MKMLVGTVAVLGALAIGGVPAIAFTLAQAEHGLVGTSSGDAADDEPGNGPPEWAKAKNHAEEMSSLGRAHGEAMRDWAACVSEHAGDKSACDPKPTPPGHLKHPEKH